MSEQATPDQELLQSFAEEARRRCDVIAAGLATETEDFETLRAEAHALKGTAGALGLRRLGHSVEHSDNRTIRGMIIKVRHLVEVTEFSLEAPEDGSQG